MDDKEGDRSSKHLIDFEVNNNEVKPLSRHGSSASSSSSNSSQDLINVHGNGDNKPLEKSEQPELKCVSFASSTELSPVNNMPAGHFPGGYVPNRIPSSIFSSKPATPMGWSTASNESLFSIHAGNSSLSKDRFFMLYKSGELTKLDEQIIAQGNFLPPLKETEEMAARNENIDRDSGATEMSKNTTTTVVETSEVAEAQSHQDNKGLQIKSVKQQQQQEQKPKQSTGELQLQNPVTPQNASSRCWFSRFNCCRYS